MTSGNEATIKRQDTDILMTPDGTSPRTAKQKLQASRLAARNSSKRILAGNFLFFRGGDKSITHENVNTLHSLGDLKRGALIADKYRITEKRMGDDASIRHAVHITSGKKVVLHFYNDLTSLMTAEVYHTSISAACVCRWITTEKDVMDCPPFLVFEGGDYTFDQWLAYPGRLFAEKRCALRKILEALVEFHGHGRLIGNLAPNRIVWFSAEHAWRLLDLRSTDTQRQKTSTPPNHGSKYAAPETVFPELWQEKRTAPEFAADMWSFGAIILEVLLSGGNLYCPDACGDSGKRLALSRQISFRLASVPGEHAYTLLRNLLHIDPIKRCTGSQALHSAFFRTPDRPRTTSLLQNEIQNLLSPGVMDTARQISAGRSSQTAKTSVHVEYFRKRSNSSDPFHLRAGKEAYAISDTILPHQSVFLLRAGQNFRLRIRHEFDDAPSASPPRRVKSVYARVDEGEYVPLDTEMMLGRRRTLEVVALVEPSRLQSPRLLVTTPTHGDLVERYVKLDVVMDAALNGDVERVEERQHVIYCKVLPRTSRMRYHRFRKKCNDAWHVRRPQNDA